MKKILYIESDLFSRKTLEEKLQTGDRIIETADDALEGLEKMQINTYDLVITGIVLPKMSGIDMLKKLKEHGIYQNKILVYSNVINTVPAKDRMNLNVAGFYSKRDYSPDSFSRIVDSLLRY